jgi:hypothetical protein
VSDGDVWTIPLEDLAEYGTLVDAAIWWPEYGDNEDGIPSPDLRSDLDLSLINPDGITQVESVSALSVFERVQWTELTADRWTLEIFGYSVPSGPQTVYWAAWVHAPPPA